MDLLNDPHNIPHSSCVHVVGLRLGAAWVAAALVLVAPAVQVARVVQVVRVALLLVVVVVHLNHLLVAPNGHPPAVPLVALDCSACRAASKGKTVRVEA